MEVIRSRDALQKEMRAARAAGRSIGFVGTSGALHEGHLSLVRHAAADNDVVLMVWTGEMAFPWAEKSNPSYPRDYDRDSSMAADAGADVLYIPRGEEMYPEPPIVRVTTPTLHRDGLTDPEHLDVVALFCTKFLALIGGCRMYMGEKDWQQLVMMRQVIADLSLPVVEFVVSPTARHDDGVPQSSRNAKLTPRQRAAAAIVPQALEAGAKAIRDGERDPAKVRQIVTRLLEAVAAVEYVQVLSETLQDIDPLEGPVRVLAAARFGEVTILDNLGVTA